ncbi:MAG TPA: DASS family sodium-coupled anion symporter [Thermoanaerobaculia bacterium]
MTRFAGDFLTRRAALLAAGPAVWLGLRFAAPAAVSPAAANVLGLAGWMAIWWIGEPVPLGATSLLPLVFFPLLGVASAKDAAAPYANELVFLFLAGFLLAAALERWNAHSRLAYAIVSAIGGGGRRIVLGVMVATGFISMWISNTATAAMMYPIALAVGALFGVGRAADEGRTALMLGVAYAASIGGIGTLIGTPPNLIFAGAARQLAGREVSFADYMLIGTPIVVVLLPLCWVLLVFVLFRRKVDLGREARRTLDERRAALGPLAGGEARTVGVFLLTVAAWLLRERKDFGAFTLPGLADVAPGLSDASVGVAGALLLFVLPDGSRPPAVSRPLLTWREAKEIPWEVLLLFGGGLSLAAAMESTGLARWLGERMGGLAGYPSIVVYAGLAALVLVLSELASNTAVAAMAMPIAASLAPAVGEPPLALMLVAALASSAGFALPVATPPNAIVFGSGQVSARQMARAGILLDLIAIAVVVTAVALLYPLVLD